MIILKIDLIIVKIIKLLLIITIIIINKMFNIRTIN